MALVTPNPSCARSGGKRASQIENTAMGCYLLPTLGLERPMMVTKDGARPTATPPHPKPSPDRLSLYRRTAHNSFKANFYEKALFVKPTWRLRCVVNATALCPSRYASIRTSVSSLSLVARCIG